MISQLLYCAHLELRDCVLRTHFEYRLEESLRLYMENKMVADVFRDIVKGKEPELFLQNVSILIVMMA